MSNFRNLIRRNLENRNTSMTKIGTTNLQTKDTGNQEIEKNKAKKPRKNKAESQTTGATGNKQVDQPDSITCHTCSQVFTDENAKNIVTWRSRSSQIAGSSMLCEQHNSCCCATVQHLMTSFCNIWWHHLYDLHILDFDDTKLVGSS